MELIRIDEEKLKMILTHEDLLEFEMNEEALDYANTETKRMFWELLRRAKQSTGFDTDGHRVLVQLYPSREGGCEIFVTRLGELPCDLDFDYDDPDKEDDMNYSERALCRRSARPCTVGFDDFSALLQCCRRLLSHRYSGESSAFCSEEGRYYLSLDPPDNPSLLYEYGSSESGEHLQAYLSEHGSAIRRGDAVALLGNL